MISDRSDRIHVYEDPSQFDAKVSIRHGKPNPARTIHVTWRDESLEFSVATRRREFDCGTILIGGRNTIEEILGELDSFLAEAYGKLAIRSEEKKGRDLNLAGIGSDLFERIIPRELQKAIREWPEETRIKISTNERWVPWELLHDGRGFLGSRFMLFRLPRLMGLPEDDDAFVNLDAPSQVQGVKIVNVIGGGLAKRDADNSRGHFCGAGPAVKVTCLHEKTVSSLLEEIPDADLVHFTCHARPRRSGGQSTFLQVAADEAPAVNFMISTLGAGLRLKKDCAVFANACGSSGAQVQFGEIVNFGWKFYEKGAALFIGTLGTVPSTLAVAFANEFYDALRNSTGGEVCEAYRRAKARMDSISQMHQLYTFYGNPVNLPVLQIGESNTEPIAG